MQFWTAYLRRRKKEQRIGHLETLLFNTLNMSFHTTESLADHEDEWYAVIKLTIFKI